MTRRIRLNSLQRVGRFLDVVECEQTFSNRQIPGPARVLRDDSASRREVASRATREPARASLDVSLLRDGELAERVLDERAVRAPVGRVELRIEYAPAAGARLLTRERLARAARLPDGDRERH